MFVNENFLSGILFHSDFYEWKLNNSFSTVSAINIFPGEMCFYLICKAAEDSFLCIGSEFDFSKNCKKLLSHQKMNTLESY